MYMFGEYGGMGFGGIGMIAMFLFWGFIIALVVLLVRQTLFKASSKNDRKPIEIAKQRYAKGEISKQEFDRLRSELS